MSSTLRGSQGYEPCPPCAKAGRMGSSGCDQYRRDMAMLERHRKGLTTANYIAALEDRIMRVRKAAQEALDRYPVPETVATTESGIVHPTGEKPVEYFRGYRNAAAHILEAFDE